MTCYDTVNADQVLASCVLVQVDGLQISSGSRGVNNGLWGVWLKNGADNLIKNLNIGNRMVRGVAVQGLQPGTVITNSELQAIVKRPGMMHVPGASSDVSC